MKKVFILLSVCMAFAYMPVQSQNNVIDEVVWVIGDEAIYKSDVEMSRLELQMNNTRLQGDPNCLIPEMMAEHKLFLHQAKLDSLDVPDAQVNQQVDAKINYFMKEFGSKEKLEEYAGKPLNALREDWRKKEKEELLVSQMKQKLVANIKTTPSEVRKYYESLPQDELPTIQTTVEVEIITVEPIIELSEIDEIKNRLWDYTEQVNSGRREFSTLARIHSEDPGSAGQGGETGFLGRALLAPEYAAVAFELNDPKKVSRVVETEFGFHIIQLIEKRGDRINTRHILLRPHPSEKSLDDAKLHMDSIRTEITSGKYTFEEAATYFSHDKDTRNNKGLMVNQYADQMSERTGTSRFEMRELPTAISTLINGMQVGDLSASFVMEDSKRKEVVAMVRLKSRTPQHRANLADDYQTLQAILEQEKQQEVLDKWLDKKQKETYIRINDTWKNCEFRRSGWVRD